MAPGRSIRGGGARKPLLWLAAALALLGSSCQLIKNETPEYTFSFNRIADSLAAFDEVTIVVRELDRTSFDTLFHGKVEQAADVRKLPAPHWDGSRRLIIGITGSIGGKIVYRVESRYDPSTGMRDDIRVFVVPDIGLSSTVRRLDLLMDDSIELPSVVIDPSGLADPEVEWGADPPSLVRIGPGYLIAAGEGSGELMAVLKASPDARLSIPISVSTSALVPESITLVPESLEVAANGPAAVISASVHPSGAPGSVDWSSADSLVAVVDADGRVRGLKPGETSILAVSGVRPSVRALAHVKVTGEVPVQRVVFAKEKLDIRVGAAPAALEYSVIPDDANPSVRFTLSDSDLAEVDDGAISGKEAGTLSVYVASTANPLARDTLEVEIAGPVPVSSVRFARESLDLLTGASPESLVVTVQPPEADQTVIFSLSDSTSVSLVRGRLSSRAAGTVSVIAASTSFPDVRDTLIVNASDPVPDDTLPPDPPKVRVSPKGPTRERRPVWTWQSGGNGSGHYQVSLDKPVSDSVNLSLADTAFAPARELDMGVHVLYVRERDDAGNWSLPGSASIEIDTAGPSAPKIHGTSPTSAPPRWTWSSGGGGGAGVFRSRLGDASFPSDAPESTDTVFTLASATSGATYTLYVEERDAAGNWSPPASLPIKYDLTEPVVSIAFPQSSGTFITALDTVTIAGSAVGPNALSKAQYSLDSGAAVSLTLGPDGAWSIPALRIPGPAISTLRVSATDVLGNTGEASLSLLWDGDQPSAPVNLSSPASPTNVVTATWTWAAGSDGPSGSGLNGKYRWKINSGNWNVVSTPSATGVALTEGANAFSVQEQDRAGNWSASVGSSVVLDTKPPDAVVFTGIDSSISTTRTPTWSWTPSASNGGTGVFILKLDGGAEFEQTARAYTPTAPLADNAWHTLTVREKDQVAGVGGAARSFTYKVQWVDPSKPWGGLKNPPVKTAGCGKATTLATGNYTITSGGQSRSYLIDIPAGYDKNHPYRMFYCSHWINARAEDVAAQDYYYLKPLAEAAGEPAIFIAPQGLPGTPGGTWSTNSSVDHVLFDDILAYAKDNLCLDSTRVFATGFSFGAIMTYSLSLNHQHQIRAAMGIAPANYNIWFPDPVPVAPIAWMQTTGTSDGTCPWVNSDAQQRGAKYVALQHARDNGCAIPSDVPKWSSGPHLCYDFSTCQEGFPVKACTFNGGHTNVNSDPGSTANWIPQESWDFFTQF